MPPRRRFPAANFLTVLHSTGPSFLSKYHVGAFSRFAGERVGVGGIIVNECTTTKKSSASLSFFQPLFIQSAFFLLHVFSPLSESFWATKGVVVQSIFPLAVIFFAIEFLSTSLSSYNFRILLNHHIFTHKCINRELQVSDHSTGFCSPHSQFHAHISRTFISVGFSRESCKTRVCGCAIFYASPALAAHAGVFFNGPTIREQLVLSKKNPKVLKIYSKHFYFFSLIQLVFNFFYACWWSPTQAAGYRDLFSKLNLQFIWFIMFSFLHRHRISQSLVFIAAFVIAFLLVFNLFFIYLFPPNGFDSSTMVVWDYFPFLLPLIHQCSHTWLSSQFQD